MNPLSKLLYFGNVAGNLGGTLVLLGIAFAITAVATFCVHSATTGNMITAARYNFNDVQAKKIVKRGLMSLWSPFFLFLAVIFWIGATFMPSRETVYAIAASEMGQRALQTPLAGKAEQALEKWLDDKIAAPKSIRWPD